MGTYQSTDVKRPLQGLPYFRGIDATAIDLIEKTLLYSADERISALGALDHAYFSSCRASEPVTTAPSHLLLGVG
jgi:serine/threonine protein kinase